MGLDNYAARTPYPFGLTEDEMAELGAAAPGLQRGPHHSGNGVLRGVHYARLVEDVTGVDLDQDWIPTEVIERMAISFERLDPDDSEPARDLTRWYPGSPEPFEVRELGAYFRTCARRGLGVVAYHDDEHEFVTVAARVPHNHGLTEADVAALDTAAPDLCGGLYSGSDGSFRGKVYVHLVLQVTGESLNEEWLPNATLHKMAKAFERCDVAEEMRQYRAADHYYDVSDEVALQLAAFFRICADRGLGLIGWS